MRSICRKLYIYIYVYMYTNVLSRRRVNSVRDSVLFFLFHFISLPLILEVASVWSMKMACKCRWQNARCLPPDSVDGRNFANEYKHTQNDMMGENFFFCSSSSRCCWGSLLFAIFKPFRLVDSTSIHFIHSFIHLFNVFFYLVWKRLFATISKSRADRVECWKHWWCPHCHCDVIVKFSICLSLSSSALPQCFQRWRKKKFSHAYITNMSSIFLPFSRSPASSRTATTERKEEKKS